MPIKWSIAVREWNAAKDWKNDFYALPRKGGKYAGEIDRLRGVEVVQKKKEEPEARLKKKEEAVSKVEPEKKSIPVVETKMETPQENIYVEDYKEIKKEVGSIFRNTEDDDGIYNVFMIRNIKKSGKILLFNSIARQQEDGSVIYSKWVKDTKVYSLSGNTIYWDSDSSACYVSTDKEVERIKKQIGIPKIVDKEKKEESKESKNEKKELKEDLKALNEDLRDIRAEKREDKENQPRGRKWEADLRYNKKINVLLKKIEELKEEIKNK